jgi:hypothetical protein
MDLIFGLLAVLHVTLLALAAACAVLLLCGAWWCLEEAQRRAASWRRTAGARRAQDEYGQWLGI